MHCIMLTHASPQTPDHDSDSGFVKVAHRGVKRNLTDEDMADKPKKPRKTKAKLSDYTGGLLNEYVGRDWLKKRLAQPDADEFYGQLLCFLKGLPLKRTAKADADFLSHALQSPIVKAALNDPDACKDALKQYRKEIGEDSSLKARFEDALKQYRRAEDIIKDLESQVFMWRNNYVEMVDIAGRECRNVDDLVYAMDRSAYHVQFWDHDQIKNFEWGSMGEAAKRLVNPNCDDESTDEEDK